MSKGVEKERGPSEIEESEAKMIDPLEHAVNMHVTQLFTYDNFIEASLIPLYQDHY